MTYEVVLTETRDGVRYVTMNRPERLNALSVELQEEVLDAVLEAEADDEVGAIVIRGAGRAFCAGFDITPRPPDGSRATVRKDIVSMRRITNWTTGIWNVSKPTVAQLHGYCVAGGTDLALHCDIVLAADDVRIGYPPVRAQGSPPTHMWTYHVGPQWAKRILLTGDFISGKQAAEIGLALASYPADQLEHEVHALASRMAMVPHELSGANKSIVNKAVELMGRSPLQESARETDAIGHLAEAGAEFRRIGREQGLKAALAWRDDRFMT